MGSSSVWEVLEKRKYAAKLLKVYTCDRIREIKDKSLQFCSKS